MAKTKHNEEKSLGNALSRDSADRSSKLSEVIKTTELGTLDSKKSNLKEQAGKKVVAKTGGGLAKQPEPKGVTLAEDHFGVLRDGRGNAHQVKRFTWKNCNKIEVQVISYGARIVSIKLPNRKGVVEDVVLGCRDLAGYLQYEDLRLGATVGRVTDRIENGTFEIDGIQYWLEANDGKDHKNGGHRGFDKVVWEPYVHQNEVILSHTSPDGDGGYPGDLLVRISFELTSKNEFNISMEAVTTKPTIVNVSNLTYFNLAGHQAGPEELYRHTVTINSNCFTATKDDDLPSGDIMNVVHTRNDFQIPTILKSRIGIEANDGYDQNLCVNRGVDQQSCFVARALHAPSGRILEIYSNQPGVQFSTANHFGSGLLNVPSERKEVLRPADEDPDDVFVLLDRIHEILLESDEDVENYDEIRKLLKRIQNCKLPDLTKNTSGDAGNEDDDISPVEMDYLRIIRDLSDGVNSSTSCDHLQQIIANIFDVARVMDRGASSDADEKTRPAKLKSEISKANKMENGNRDEEVSNNHNVGNYDHIIELIKRIQHCKFEHIIEEFNLATKSGDVGTTDSDRSPTKVLYLRNIQNLANKVTGSMTGKQLQAITADILETIKVMDEAASLAEITKKSLEKCISTSGQRQGDTAKSEVPFEARKGEANGSKKSNEGHVKSERLHTSDGNSAKASDTKVKRKEATKEGNVIPSFYKDGRLHGKNDAVYKRHGAIAFQTQNYPNAVYHKNFPISVLRPGQTYRHTLSYKFWIQSGNPTMWTKRNCL